jgi:hypothetical protein
MRVTTAVLAATGLLAGTATAYHLVSRRSFASHSVAGVGSLLLTTPSAYAADEFIMLEDGLQYRVLKEGDGGIPAQGQTVKAHYTGWLDGFDSDKKFDSSRDRGRPFTFKVGAGQVIRGWDETFSQMKVGERRQIILPPRLAYGDRGGKLHIVWLWWWTDVSTSDQLASATNMINFPTFFFP